LILFYGLNLAAFAGEIGAHELQLQFCLSA